MSQFNPIEKAIAYVLSFTPGLKHYIKWIYQFLNYLFYRKNYRFRCNYQVATVNNSLVESFFGYYDKSPETSDGALTLFQESFRSTRKKPSCKDAVNIVLKENSSDKSISISNSQAYNWQQGTKLQWLSNNEFIFNFFDSATQEYKSAIYRSDGILSRKLEWPVYDTFAGEYALSLNFDRLNSLRPDYGYRCRNTALNFNDCTDGVFYIDIKQNICHLLISLEQLKKIKPLLTMENAQHKVNHFMIAPNGELFLFMHRWVTENGKRYDRLLVADRHGSNIKIVADDEMVSHCCWFNNQTIIGYMKHNSHGTGFYRIDLEQNRTTLLSEKLRHLGDGHPSFNGNKMVFDSYPDRSRMKHLYLYDIEKDSVENIGEFYESLAYYGETRCDLHPKWSLDGKSIYIDSVHEGKRKLYKIQLQ